MKNKNLRRREVFGWMNASYQVGLSLLPSGYPGHLKKLIPPDSLFRRRGRMQD